VRNAGAFWMGMAMVLSAAALRATLVESPWMVIPAIFGMLVVIGALLEDDGANG
jgi:hypothetical protein